jgi:hypothetical protein
MKARLSWWIAIVALLMGTGAVRADVLTVFTASGMFSDGTTLGGTMTVDTTIGCVVGSAGCPGAPPMALTVSAFPTLTFDLGANPGPPVGDTVGLPLISNPFCCGDLSMQVFFTVPEVGGIGTLVGYDGGPITSGQVVQDCGVNGTCDIHSGLTGTFTPQATSTVPEPSTWAMMIAGFGLLGFLGYRKTRSALA